MYVTINIYPLQLQVHEEIGCFIDCGVWPYWGYFSHCMKKTFYDEKVLED